MIRFSRSFSYFERLFWRDILIWVFFHYWLLGWHDWLLLDLVFILGQFRLSVLSSEARCDLLTLLLGNYLLLRLLVLLLVIHFLRDGSLACGDICGAKWDLIHRQVYRDRALVDRGGLFHHAVFLGRAFIGILLLIIIVGDLRSG